MHFCQTKITFVYENKVGHTWRPFQIIAIRVLWRTGESKESEKERIMIMKSLILRGTYSFIWKLGVGVYRNMFRSMTFSLKHFETRVKVIYIILIYLYSKVS